MASLSSMLRVISSVLWTLLIAGCETPNVFHNEKVGRPHATLVSENAPGMRGFAGLGRKVSPLFINQQPTAFWRVSDRFRLPPGETTVDVIDTRKPYGYETLRFVAVSGHLYLLRPVHDGSRDAVTLSEQAPDTRTERVVARAFRNAP